MKIKILILILLSSILQSCSNNSRQSIKNSTHGEKSPLITSARDIEINYDASKVDNKKTRSLFISIVEKECLRLKIRSKKIFKGTGWYGCDIHIAKVPRIGLSVEDLMNIVQAEGMLDHEDVVKAISGRADIKAYFSAIKDNMAASRTSWVDKDIVKTYVEKLDVFCKISGVQVSMPTCPHQEKVHTPLFP